MGFKRINHEELELSLSPNILGMPLKTSVKMDEKVSVEQFKTSEIIEKSTNLQLFVEEAINFKHYKDGKKSEIKGTGFIRIVNGSRKDRIWDTNITFTGNENVDLKLGENVKIGNLEPNTSKNLDYNLVKTEDLQDPISVSEKIEFLNREFDYISQEDLFREPEKQKLDWREKARKWILEPGFQTAIDQIFKLTNSPAREKVEKIESLTVQEKKMVQRGLKTNTTKVTGVINELIQEYDKIELNSRGELLKLIIKHAIFDLEETKVVSEQVSGDSALRPLKILAIKKKSSKKSSLTPEEEEFLNQMDKVRKNEDTLRKQKEKLLIQKEKARKALEKIKNQEEAIEQEEERRERELKNQKSIREQDEKIKKEGLKKREEFAIQEKEIQKKEEKRDQVKSEIIKQKDVRKQKEQALKQEKQLLKQKNQELEEDEKNKKLKDAVKNIQDRIEKINAEIKDINQNIMKSEKEVKERDQKIRELKNTLKIQKDAIFKQEEMSRQKGLKKQKEIQKIEGGLQKLKETLSKQKEKLDKQETEIKEKEKEIYKKEEELRKEKELLQKKEEELRKQKEESLKKAVKVESKLRYAREDAIPKDSMIINHVNWYKTILTKYFSGKIKNPEGELT
ncbi:MAG: hypothetical protein ACTSRW_16185, partial [Candidatus Helarchaeota archaeon]